MTADLVALERGAGQAGDKPALVVIGHGSRSTAGVQQFWRLVQCVAALVPEVALSGGFIELAAPHVDDAVDALLAPPGPGGSRTGADPTSAGPGGPGLVSAKPAVAVAVPLVLLGAGHLKLDGPAVLARARARHPGTRFSYARELGVHPLVLAVAEDRIRETLAALEGLPPPLTPGCASTGPGGQHLGTGFEDTAVVLVGRGSTDPDANADLYKAARLLGDSRGLGQVEPAFVSLAEPSVPSALDRCRRLGARRLAVVPYFLFTGVLVDRIGAQAAQWAAGHPGHQVTTGRELGPDPRLAALVVQRYREATDTAPDRSCDCCIYRNALPGYESRRL